MARGGSDDVTDNGVEEELEAMREEDSSWHPCRVSLSSTGVGLVVDFGDQEPENMILDKEEELSCLRFRSVPLQGGDCSHIKEGDRVLASHKSHYKTLFLDAEVEKTLRVRHSARIHCRCTFMIKWLQQDLKVGTETLTVPSTSILKLASKSVNNHPTVAAFLNSLERSSCYDASLFPTVPEDIDYETNLHKLLEKQIKEISNLSEASNKKVSEDILLEFKVDTKGQFVCKPDGVSKRSISSLQGPAERNHTRMSTRSRGKRQVEMEVKDLPSSAPIMREERSENRVHLSPLAARAALASFRSKLPLDLEFSVCSNEGKVTKSFNSCGGNSSVMDQTSSDTLTAFAPVVEPTDIFQSQMSLAMGCSGNLQHVKENSRTSARRRKNEKKTSESTNSCAGIACSTLEKRLSESSQITGLTFSGIQINTDNANNNCELMACTAETKLGPVTRTRRSTRKSVQNEVGNLTVEVRQELEKTKCSQFTASKNSEGNDTFSGNDVPEKSELISSQLDCETDSHPIEKRNTKRKTSSAVKNATPKDKGKVSATSSSQRKRMSAPSKGQELRSSQRLRFLPRTRSQNRS
ncbi:uncharacterized protein LOC131159375 isoform X1 [Malania oleifera]|uniref:uncharacterized protein LOC131159375 isoform X1 n=1 Tax=Malania oleifera TaxID=397392 RepID=UPI0025AE8392|nr:uncharacterized protein LOC131159375 isoform X1 [Malania oleifera]XP_057970228.1 uncharacterized protein LOC131159375 isoform X1 [Malania oleifera]